LEVLIDKFTLKFLGLRFAEALVNGLRLVWILLQSEISMNRLLNLLSFSLTLIKIVTDAFVVPVSQFQACLLNSKHSIEGEGENQYNNDRKKNDSCPSIAISWNSHHILPLDV
jgi:hypothetical protein